MEQLIEPILSSPLYTIITIIIFVALIFFLIKKLFKLVIYAIIIFIGFMAYVYFTGGDVKETINNTMEKGEKIFK